MGSRISGRRAVAVAAALALVLGACGDDDDGDDASTATTAAPGDDETTTTSEAAAGDGVEVQALDYAFSGLPEEIEAGAFEFAFSNVGEVDHEIAFVSLGTDTTPEQFFTEFAPVIEEGAAFPDYAESIAVMESPPGVSSDLVFTLPEGRYLAFCALTGDAENPDSEEGAAPHFERGMQQEVTVTGGDAGELAAADGTITASDYTFEVDIPAGATRINFVNEGPDQVHFAGVDKFPEGTTVEQAEAAFATMTQLEEGAEPPADLPQSEEFFFSGIASQGLGIQSSAPGPFEPGTYIAYCFIQDRQGGPPHAIGYQMYKAFTVE